MLGHFLVAGIQVWLTGAEVLILGLIRTNSDRLHLAFLEGHEKIAWLVFEKDHLSILTGMGAGNL